MLTNLFTQHFFLAITWLRVQRNSRKDKTIAR